ncbi:MAG TPA: FAD-dependent oxidoreductase [Candidatus Krumholzibacteria bacterium]|nr:FAD-dependent oxidoreductase [Candidatus Krumholzibacteria bacterium]
MTLPARADVVICGAGIAGIAVAQHLAVHEALGDIFVVDERPPLTLTSDKSTEAYRNFWPGPDAAMIQLMNRSLDLMQDLAQQTDNVFRMNQRGYLYATASSEHARALAQAAVKASEGGAGPLRVHTQAQSASYAASPAEGLVPGLEGADLLQNRELLRTHFPELSAHTVAALHVRRCGWFSGQQLGMLLLERARARGVTLLRARLEAVECAAGRVSGVEVEVDGKRHRVATGCFVNAAGPHVREVAALCGVELPIHCELHLKAAFQDALQVVPRTAPLLIWDDAQRLEWSEDERSLLAASPETQGLLDLLPAGVHARPEGGTSSAQILILWPTHVRPVSPVFPIPDEPDFAEIALRGMSAMLPGLRAYLGAMPRAFVDGGYYVKTAENRFVAGPMRVPGAYVLGALSGYGLMAACGAAELLAAHITGRELPEYAGAFTLERYEDPKYVERLRDWGPTGEL